MRGQQNIKIRELYVTLGKINAAKFYAHTFPLGNENCLILTKNVETNRHISFYSNLLKAISYVPLILMVTREHEAKL